MNPRVSNGRLQVLKAKSHATGAGKGTFEERVDQTLRRDLMNYHNIICYVWLPPAQVRNGD